MEETKIQFSWRTPSFSLLPSVNSDARLLRVYLLKVAKNPKNSSDERFGFSRLNRIRRPGPNKVCSVGALSSSFSEAVFEPKDGDAVTR